ncbi:MAG TPA: response regulator transcription factor [Desulfuromonadales bacterium]|nr:response regulator transcription factor [Desulfuromonadales bacterium]
MEAKLRIIIVEDEEVLRTVLVTILTRLGHDVRGAGDGAALDLALADYPADVVVLDLNLPDEDGVDIAQRLRRTCSCGIIMTTGRGQVEERVNGFQGGADLYFVKPIDPLELHAALLNLARRLTPAESPAKKIAWHFDPQLSTVRTPHGISINLTAHEYIVMQQLLAVPGKTVSRSELFSALGHPDDEYGSKRVETLLSRLRSKVRHFDPESELPIRARHGIGYAFLADLQQ